MPSKFGQAGPHGGLEVTVVVGFDQVNDGFGVGLGHELMTALGELLSQIEVVFDDAVMDNDDLASTVEVRMGILLGRPTVCSPACVADTVVSRQRVLADLVLEID